MADKTVIDMDSAGALAPPDVVLKMNGKTHAMKPMSVGDFIFFSRAQKKADDVKDPAEQLEALVGLITRVFPTVKRDELEALPLTNLLKIAQYAQGTGEEIAAQAAAAEGKSEGNA